MFGSQHDHVTSLCCNKSYLNRCALFPISKISEIHFRDFVGQEMNLIWQNMSKFILIFMFYKIGVRLVQRVVKVTSIMDFKRTQSPIQIFTHHC